MQFTPKSEQEIQLARLRPEGLYPFTVLESKEQASKSQKNNGRMMFAIKHLIHGAGGDTACNDYFADWFGEHKLRHFAESVGLLGDYEAGSLDGNNNAFKDRTGYLRLKITKPKEGDQYGPKNEIVDYYTEEEFVKLESERKAKEASAKADEIDMSPSPASPPPQDSECPF